MKFNQGLIEYIGISKKLDSPIIFEKEVTVNYKLTKQMEEVIKIQSSVEVLDFQGVTNNKGFITVKINNLFEYIENRQEQSLCAIEKDSRYSFLIDYNNGTSLEKIKVQILNMRGKLLSKKEMIIYYKVGVTS